MTESNWHIGSSRAIDAIRLTCNTTPNILSVFCFIRLYFIRSIFPQRTSNGVVAPATIANPTHTHAFSETNTNN